jgi:hypothetical protein
VDIRPRRGGHEHDWSAWVKAGHGKAMSRRCMICRRVSWRSLQNKSEDQPEPYWAGVSRPSEQAG